MTLPMLLTCPAAQSAEFAAELDRRLPGRFAPVVVAPLLEIAHHGGPVDLGGVSGLLFSSANGVEGSPPPRRSVRSPRSASAR